MNKIMSNGMKTFRIGMVGAGTVGSGVYELIMGRLGGSSQNTEKGTLSSSFPVHNITSNPSFGRSIITKICVRDISKPRSFHIDERFTQIVTDVESIIHDDSIDVVVEVMGGTGIAKKVVLDSLKRGKSVVTANKALIAENLDEIRQIVLNSNGKVRFAYEASVCGGIPIIQILQNCYVGDVVNEVMGICNGTTNYMLGKMDTGADYNMVLKEAQELGYAEADPTADVEGHDVRAKIAILAKLAFGTTVPVDSIHTQGITRLTTADFEYAKLMGCTIKLVGTATRLSKYSEHDGALSVFVSPKVVSNSHLLASARGAGNAVAVRSGNLGIASYTGPGAGRYPTANSIVADICRITSGVTPIDPFPLQSSIELDHDFTSPFYIRISFCDGLGIIRRVGEVAERHGVSIDSVLQNPIKDRTFANFVVTTEECRLSQVIGMCRDIGNEDFARDQPLCMPLLLE